MKEEHMQNEKKTPKWVAPVVSTIVATTLLSAAFIGRDKVQDKCIHAARETTALQADRERVDILNAYVTALPSTDELIEQGAKCDSAPLWSDAISCYVDTVRGAVNASKSIEFSLWGEGERAPLPFLSRDKWTDVKLLDTYGVSVSDIDSLLIEDLAQVPYGIRDNERIYLDLSAQLEKKKGEFAERLFKQNVKYQESGRLVSVEGLACYSGPNGKYVPTAGCEEIQRQREKAEFDAEVFSIGTDIIQSEVSDLDDKRYEIVSKLQTYREKVTEEFGHFAKRYGEVRGYTLNGLERADEGTSLELTFALTKQAEACKQ
jgi:hypothetical protein